MFSQLYDFFNGLLGRLNAYWPGSVRDVTPDEFAKVWALAKSLNPDKSEQPQPDELIEAVQELFPEFKERPMSELLKSLKDAELTLDPSVAIPTYELDCFLRLQGKSPREQDLAALKRHEITFREGDALAAHGMAVLVGYFEAMCEPGSLGYARIGLAVVYASESDPAYLHPTVTIGKSRRVTFAWPSRKLKEWLRLAVEC
jgi:hypothetical protein